MHENPQLAMALSVDEKASFANFWVGCNEELVAALKASSQAPPSELSDAPVYLYGQAASGKSHLLYAAMRRANENKINTSFLPLADPYITPVMLDLVDMGNLVCVDDVNAWAGRLERERALFTLFERIKAAGGQLVVSASDAIDRLVWALPDLRSRLASGLIYPLYSLDHAEQVEMLKFRARHKGLDINHDVLKFLAQRSSRDTGELVALLDAIDQRAMIEKRRVTIPFIKQFFG